MPSINQRYPLSTPEGVAIPLDIMRPYGYLRKGFSTVVSSNIPIPDELEIVLLYATEDCLVTFGGNAEASVDGIMQLNTVFIPKDMRICVAPTSTFFTVRGDALSGQLSVQFIDKWAGLVIQNRLKRI